MDKIFVPADIMITKKKKNNLLKPFIHSIRAMRGYVS